ncbi:proteoglycan 4-like [Hydractinia symbiolongicarpus]|uniref:proteoglycan 4-like n=1 Tax=Hydractinia symbiolongicarpus TaxID=13093 RepID=UPI00254C015E|nr:proteoglycan 4-like [Hydractinia symbiolongicarpus]
MLLSILLILSVADVSSETITTTNVDYSSDYVINIQTDDNPDHLCKVDRRFLSIAFGIGQINKTVSGYDIDSDKLRNIMTALSPSYVRIGGTKANFLYFEPRKSGSETTPTTTATPDDLTPPKVEGTPTTPKTTITTTHAQLTTTTKRKKKKPVIEDNLQITTTTPSPVKKPEGPPQEENHHEQNLELSSMNIGEEAPTTPKTTITTTHAQLTTTTKRKKKKPVIEDNLQITTTTPSPIEEPEGPPQKEGHHEQDVELPPMNIGEDAPTTPKTTITTTHAQLTTTTKKKKKKPVTEDNLQKTTTTPPPVEEPEGPPQEKGNHEQDVELPSMNTGENPDDESNEAETENNEAESPNAAEDSDDEKMPSEDLFKEKKITNKKIPSKKKKHTTPNPLATLAKKKKTKSNENKVPIEDISPFPVEDKPTRKPATALSSSLSSKKVTPSKDTNTINLELPRKKKKKNRKNKKQSKPIEEFNLDEPISRKKKPSTLKTTGPKPVGKKKKGRKLNSDASDVELNESDMHDDDTNDSVPNGDTTSENDMSNDADSNLNEPDNDKSSDGDDDDDSVVIDNDEINENSDENDPSDIDVMPPVPKKKKTSNKKPELSLPGNKQTNQKTTSMQPFPIDDKKKPSTTANPMDSNIDMTSSPSQLDSNTPDQLSGPEFISSDSIATDAKQVVPSVSANDVTDYKQKKKKANKKKKSKNNAITPEDEEAAFQEKKKEKLRGYRNFTMTADFFDNLYGLIDDTKNEMLFDINAFPRKDGMWDPSNAIEFFDYVSKRNYKVNWQLGNEPNHYQKLGEGHKRTGEEVGKDYVLFADILSQYGNPKIVGPDTTRPKREDGPVSQWLTAFLSQDAEIDALSWHQYYANGRTVKAEEFLDPDLLDDFTRQCAIMKSIAKRANFNKQIWLTETGSAWGGGAKNISNRYVAGFPFLDKLGVAAKFCMKVVARQTFLSGSYAMVDWKQNYTPFPDYYLAVLFKRLVGQAVLRVTVDSKSNDQDLPDDRFRVYAHCTRKSRRNPPGSITVYILNLHSNSKKFSFGNLELLKVKQYLLTADSLQSDVVKLNGVPLKMSGNSLPRMKSKMVEQPIHIPGQSFGFFVIDTAMAAVCE